MRSLKDLHKYQKDTIARSVLSKNAAVLLGTGLGKTIVALTIIDQLLKRKLIKKTLLVCTKKAMFNTWRQEAVEWEHTKYLKFSMLHGSARSGKSDQVRKSNLLSKADIYLINYEGLVWLSETLGTRRFKFDFDCVIYDESTKLKHTDTKRFKCFKKYMSLFKYKYIMTGTFMPNGCMDIFGQMYALDQGKRLGKGIVSFRNEFFNAYNRQCYTEYELKKGAKKQIISRIKDICLYLKKEDYIKLPAINYSVIPLELSKKSLGMYKELEKEMYLEVSETPIEVFASSALSIKLRQFLSGALYYADGESTMIAEVHNEKIQALKELTEKGKKGNQIFEDNCIIAYSFKFEKQYLKKVFPNAPSIDGFTSEAETADIILRWNKRELPVLLFNSASESHGLNLQKGGSIILWFSLTWNLENYIQLIDRLYRQGQKRKVFVHHFVFRHTVDERILKVLISKMKEQVSTLEKLQRNR